MSAGCGNCRKCDVPNCAVLPVRSGCRHRRDGGARRDSAGPPASQRRKNRCHHDQPTPEQIDAARFDVHAVIAEAGVVELVARERDMHPGQCNTEGYDRQQSVAEEKPQIMPGRSGLPGIDATPYRARQAIAPRAEQGDLEEDEKRDEINALDACRQYGIAERQAVDDDIVDAERRQHRERDEKAEEELATGAGIFEPIAADADVAPEIAPQPRRRPKAIDADRDQREKEILRQQPDETGPALVRRRAHRPCCRGPTRFSHANPQSPKLHISVVGLGRRCHDGR